jgi:hypothetical protein
MDWLIDVVGDRWYFVAGIGGILVLAVFVIWRLSRGSERTQAREAGTTFLDVLLIWPSLLNHDRKTNLKSHWLTRREVILAVLMVLIVVIAVYITPSGRTP